MTREPKDYEVTFWFTVLIVGFFLAIALSIGAVLLLIFAVGYAIWFTATHGLTPYTALFLGAVVAGVLITAHQALRRRDIHRTRARTRPAPIGPRFRTTHILHGDDQ